MEKTTFSISIENERLDALTYFLSAKSNSSPQKELERLFQELYEKTVPPETRAYVDSKLKKPSAKPKAAAKRQIAADSEDEGTKQVKAQGL
jgi:hypothetical protein